MEILKVKKQNLKEVEKTALRYLKTGKITICPTDTVYGLLADATSEKAAKKIFEIKKRPKEKAIPIFIKDIKTAKKIAFINKKQEEFLKKNWPGKLTAVLKRKGKFPKMLFGGKKTIALRIPDYKLVNNLLEKLNRPLIGTSANISGQSASTRIKEIIKQFQDKKFQPDLILDAGNLKKSKASTIIDLTEREVKILRQGEIKL